MAYWLVQLALLLFVAVVNSQEAVVDTVGATPVVDSQQVLPLEAPRCSKEAQIVMCGGLPLDTLEDQAVYAQCCQLHEPRYVWFDCVRPDDLKKAKLVVYVTHSTPHSYYLLRACCLGRWSYPNCL